MMVSLSVLVEQPVPAAVMVVFDFSLDLLVRVPPWDSPGLAKAALPFGCS